MLALLPALTRQAALSADTLAALRLPDAVQVELRRMASAGGFEALAAQARPMASPLPDTLRLVASRDAAQVQALNYEPPDPANGLNESAQFFLIEIWSFSEGPLAFDAAGAGIALHTCVSWPYRHPGSPTATAAAERERVTFNLASRR